ncbi:MAG TPA: efflux RND transporter periplasmic adaptor subunit [Candidatus Manganitrophaceae bacterium]|nr:efflux RND transporter periplasmic adaptor subunit [Candidatus Manganitrophaceae bacterium]
MTEQRRPIRKILFLAAVLIAAAGAVKFFFSGRSFPYAGTLEATKVDLSARVSSAIGAVRVQEGDHVVENQELVVLLCEDLKVAADLANQNYQRTLRLFRSEAVSQEALDLARNRKEDLDVRLGWCLIRSPIQGTVLNRYHEPGESVNPGIKLLTLANIRNIWAYIYVPQPEVSKLQVGMKLKGALPELNNREFDGTIIKINEEAEFTPKNVQTRSERTRLVYGVKISFLESNAEEILKPGMTIEVRLPQG